MAEKVILEVDVTGVTQSLLDARATLQGYKLALEDAIATNGKYSKEAEIAKAMVDSQNKSVKQLEGQLTRIVQVQEATNESLQDLMKNGYEPANKTVDQNRKVLNALTAEYNKASKEQREKLAPAIKNVSDELKKQEGAVGDTRRNVGNYTESLMQAFSGLQGFGGQIVQVGQSIGAGVNAFKAAEGGVRGFGLALATTGLPLFISGVNLLIEAFSQFKPLADAVEVGVAQLKGAFDAIITGRSISEVAAQAAELARRMQGLDDAQLGASVTTARYDADIKKLLVQLRNKSNSYKDNQKVLEQLDEAERKSFELKRKLAQEEAMIEKQKYANKVGLTTAEIDALIERGEYQNKYTEERIKQLALESGYSEEVIRKTIANEQKAQKAVADAAEQKAKISDKELKRIADLQVAVINIEGESAVLREKIANRREQIDAAEKQRIDDIEKARQLASEKEVSRLNKIADENARLEKLRIESLLEGQEKEKALYELEFEKRIEDLRKAGLTEIQITELKNKEIAAIDARYAKKRVADKEATNRQIQEQEQKLQDELIAQADRAAQAQAAADLKMINNLTSFVTDALSKAAQLVNAFADQNIEALENQFQQGIIDERTYNQEAYELKVKAFKETKALNITQAVIATLQSSLNAFNSGLQAGGPFGLVLGAIFAAAAAAFGGAQIALIAKQQPPPPTFAEGGQVFNVGGKSHAEGGTLYRGSDGNTFEVERGEKIFVMKANASRHIDALGGLNMAFGGRSWSDSPIRYAADGGMIQDGGFAIRQTSERASDMAMLKQFAKSIAEEIPTPVVSVTEINKVNKSRNRSIKTSEL